MVMQQVSVNLWAVLVAAIAGMAIGFLWFGPLFGKQYMAFMNLDKKKMKEAKKKGMGKTFTIAFLSTLLMSYILAHFVGYVQATTIVDGIVLAFQLWLVFFATTELGMILWEGKPFKLYAIKTLHNLVSLAVMGAILAVWA